MGRFFRPGEIFTNHPSWFVEIPRDLHHDNSLWAQYCASDSKKQPLHQLVGGFKPYLKKNKKKWSFPHKNRGEKSKAKSLKPPSTLHRLATSSLKQKPLPDFWDSSNIPTKHVVNRYCWWLKSCTTWDVWNPINNGKNYLSTGAGFQPSTVCLMNPRFPWSRMNPMVPPSQELRWKRCT